MKNFDNTAEASTQPVDARKRERQLDRIVTGH